MSKNQKRSRSSKNQVSMYKGLPLIDANKDLEICVTKRDVSISRKNDPSNCAAANAIKREVETAEAEVHISRTYILDEEKQCWVRFITPDSISREIVAFDRSAIFEPGNYLLKAPGEAARLGSYKNSKRGPHTTTRKAPRHHTVNIRESAR